MNKEKNGNKKVITEISEETMINLKILSLRKRVTLAEYVKDMIEKHVNSKTKQSEELIQD